VKGRCIVTSATPPRSGRIASRAGDGILRLRRGVARELDI
jgi:hypothetical protein